MTSSDTLSQLRDAIDGDRLIETATQLVGVPSPTGEATAVLDLLADLTDAAGLSVERVDADWPKAPAVAARLNTGVDGPTIQFNGHLDTVHLDFVPPRVEDGILYGSGASDMKGGVAAMLEAARVLKETGLLTRGSVLLTGHDLHEFPWGDGRQVNALIDAGYIGDGVLLPEYLCSQLPVVGRGLAVWEVTIRRSGDPVHEVLGGIDHPNVLFAAAELMRRLQELDVELRAVHHPMAGRASVFVGQIHGGVMFNQSPTEVELSGTRRWLPGTSAGDVEQEFIEIAQSVARDSQTEISVDYAMARDAYELTEHAFVESFQEAYSGLEGTRLTTGAKPFVDDGNAFVSRGGIPAITHGPDAHGAHTLNERVPVAELERVALVYAMTAVNFCQA